VCVADGRFRLPVLALIVVLSCPCVMLGQRNGGHSRRPLICVHDCSTSADEATPEDELKGFNATMALQGTPEQSTALISLVHDLQATKDKVQTVQPNAAGPQKISGTIVVVDQSIAKLNTDTQGFLESFSPAQRAGLKDACKKVEDADSQLIKELGALDQVVKDPKAVYQQVTDSAATVAKTLGTVEEGQLALAREMGIILPSSELVFHLEATNSTNIGKTRISIPVSTDLSRTSSVNGDNVFTAKIVADLSDLQDNIVPVLRSQLPPSATCGERIELREAMFVAEPPPSRLFTRVHVERWICSPGGRWGGPTEIASGDGSVELWITPGIEKDGKLDIDCQISRADGNDFARDSLLGDVGKVLKDAITTSVGLVIQNITAPHLQPTSPGSSPAMDKAQFQQNAGHLALLLNGRLELSDQQTQEFANQVKQQQLSAQQGSSP